MCLLWRFSAPRCSFFVESTLIFVTGRCACPSPPLASRAHRGLCPLAAPPAVTHLPRAPSFRYRLRAGAGRRSGSGWRPRVVLYKGGGRVGFAGGRPLLSRRVGRGERSAPGLRLFLRLLSRPRFRPSRGRAGVSLGLDGCEVRLCDPCVRVCAGLGFFSIRERVNFNTRYHHISSYIIIYHVTIMIYHCVSSSVS